ncbi:MAG: hypothetical protein AB9903_15920 [Vulcanimicrobiota bacterium]
MESLYQKVTDGRTANEDRSGIWDQIVNKSEEYLKMEGGFNPTSFGPMKRYATSDPAIQFVTLSAPEPYLAGATASNWNFIQWKDDKGIHVQSIGKDDCNWYHSGKVWKEGGTTFLTGLGLSKISNRYQDAHVTVFEKKEEGWVPSENRFTSPVSQLERHDLYRLRDGSFSVENDVASFECTDFLKLSFIDNSSDISIKGKEEHILTLQDGVYHLHPDESVRERRQKQMKKELEESITRLSSGDNQEQISIEDNQVNICGVTLPIRSPGM